VAVRLIIFFKKAKKNPMTSVIVKIFGCQIAIEI